MEGFQFQNWARTYGCQPSKYFEPTNEEEIRRILAEARRDKRKVRVVGSGHSPSDICCTPDYMISMKRFNQVLNINAESRLVLVEAGVLVGDLVEKLKTQRLALSVLPSISDLTIAGAIATGTHGTGIRFPMMAAYVQSLELMTADGEIRKLTAEADGDVFLAACASLGALGIVLRIELKCDSYFQLRNERELVPVDDALSQLQENLAKSDHFRLYIYPYVDEVVQEHLYRVEADPAQRTKRNAMPIERAKSWFWGTLIGFHFLELMMFLSTFLPLLVRCINQFFFWFFYKFNAAPATVVDSYENIFTFNCLFRQYVMEYALPVELAGKALRTLKRTVEKLDIPAHFPIEVRFVKGDNLLLSPAYNRDSCYVNVVMYRPYGREPAAQREFWRAYDDVMHTFQGRPHLAKDHPYDRLAMSLAFPKFERFCEIQREMDPSGLFVNECLQRILN